MKVNQLKAGALLSYLSMFVTIIVGLVYTPIMLRMLGQSEYGVYSLIGSFVGYLTILDLGLGNAVVRYVARNRAIGDKNAESNLNGMFLILYSFIGLLTLIIGAILYYYINDIFGSALTVPELKKAKIMTILLVFNFAISFPLGVFGSIMQAYERFIFVKVASLIRSLLNPLIILPLLFVGYGSVSMVVVNTILNIVFLLSNLFYCLKILKIKIYFNKINFELLREVAGYSFFIFLGIIVDKIYWSTGQFVLGIVSGTVLVAIYAVAMQIINLYIMFSTSISGVFLPRISIMVANNANNEELSQMMIKIGRVQYVIMAYILSGFILFGQAFINFWAGSDYSNAYYIVLIIMMAITFPLIQNVGIAILQAKNLHAFRSIAYICIAVINVIVSIPLAKIWGGLGCAFATGVSQVLGNVLIINIYYYRKVGLNILLFWKNIASMSLPVLLSLTFGYGINYFFAKNGILILLGKIVLFSVAYICIMWFVGLNRYERNLFYSPLKRLLDKFVYRPGWNTEKR